jgi:hypothetical protein
MGAGFRRDSATSMVPFRLSRPFGASTIDILSQLSSQPPIGAANLGSCSACFIRFEIRCRGSFDRVRAPARTPKARASTSQHSTLLFSGTTRPLPDIVRRSISAMTNHRMGCNYGNFSVADIGTAALVLWALGGWTLFFTMRNYVSCADMGHNKARSRKIQDMD